MASGAVASMLNIIILLFSYRIYLEYLGYELYGLWLVLAAILALAQTGELGIGPAITKLVAEVKGKGDLVAAQGYVACGLLILTITGAAATAVVVMLRSPILALLHVGNEHVGLAYSLLPFAVVSILESNTSCLFGDYGPMTCQNDYILITRQQIAQKIEAANLLPLLHLG